ncbi:MAG: ComF family protein [Sandaracinaceae bacterium]
MFRRLSHGLLDLLAPLRCAACDFPLPSGLDGFCEGCGLLLDPVSDVTVDRAAYLHGGPLAEAIARYKYQGRSELAGPLARLLVEAARPLAGRFDLIASVPLHPRRLRARGYDQTALWVGPLARALGGRPARELLERRRDTPPQVGLSADARAANVRGAFSLPQPARVQDQRVLLIDDVRTTGATLAACAERVLAAGAATVETLVLARREG